MFVVGSMRSGSTMLRLILDSHPNVAIGAETGFVGALLAAKRIPSWRFGEQWYGRLGWSEAEMDARLRDFYSGLFERHAAEQGKPRWGEKTPFHTAHMAAMAQIFPDAVFVGIVRHPGAAAVSLRDNFHYGFGDALSYWSATNLDMVRAACGLGSRFTLCRYEDLVTHSEPVLRELTSWLGEPWSPDLLEHHRVQRERGTPALAEGSTSTRDRIDAGRAQSWEQATSPADREALAAVQPLAVYFGYEGCAGPGPGTTTSEDPEVGPLGPHEALARLAGPRRWLPDGDDLARGRAAWAARVDFEERPPTLSIDASPQELATRLAQLEQALERTRSRRSVRLGEALRRVQRGRSWHDVREAWTVLRGLAR